MSTEGAEPGRLLAGRYRLAELIGEGGMGRVWQGTDELLDRPVAIKELTIPPHLPSQEVEVLRARMLREARSAAQLSHPSIITVFDVVEIDDRPWIVMELVRGPSLSGVIKEEGTLPPARVARIGLQVATALAVAHERGVVHRDIKPGNVLIARGDRAVLTDFGIAQLEGTTNLTRTGLLVGSPGYLAPEQAHGQAASPATDAWSLGVTLYQAVQGTSPFQRPTPMATLTAIVTEEVPPPTEAGPLRPLLEGLLDKDASRRLEVGAACRMLQEVAEAATGGEGPKAGAGDRERAGAARAVPVAPEPAGAAPAAPASAAAVPVPGAGDGGRPVRRVLLPVVGAVVVLAVAVAVGLWLGMRGPANVERAGANGGTPSATPAEEGEKARQADGEEETKRPEEPETTRHEDPTGFEVDLPKGWTQDRREGTSVFFDIPGGGYLQIDQTDDPRDNAKRDWERQEPALSQNFPGYELERIAALDEPYLDRYGSAADWEFTFDGDGTRMHAVNRAFHTDEKGYALFLVSPEDTWEENRALLDHVTESFEPAG